MKGKIRKYIRALLPRSIRQRKILFGPLSGNSIVTSWYNYPAALLGYTERALLEWLDKNVNSGETWLDVGAHYGFTAIALSKLVVPAGRVFAFEPMLSTAGYLDQTRQANRFHQMAVIPFALGEGSKLTTIKLPVTRGMVDGTIAHTDWEETVFVAGLDWLWPQICGGDAKIDGIKIDVQGMELQTLQGMIGILKTYQPKLVIEFHSGVNRDHVLSLLESAGYSREAIPIEAVAVEDQPGYLDNRSYAFVSRDGYIGEG